jgi:hypothetical protein
MKMTEPKRNPNPFIRAAQAAKEEREKKFDIPGAHDKVEHAGKAPKMTTVPRATKVMRKAGRGR